MPRIDLHARIWTADVVYTGFGAPMQAGGVAVVGEHVAQTGPLQDLQRAYPDAPIEHKGRYLGIPPVNAHTHLDLSAAPRYQGTYVGFVRHVIQHTRRGARGLEAARRGMAELQSHRAAAFGDIVTREEVMRWLLTESPLPGVAYWEVIAPDPTKAAEVFREVKARIERWRALERPGGVRIGLSPHAPHTVSAPLLKRLAEYARLEGLPMQIHTAESPAELEYFQRGTGPLAAFLREVTGLSHPAPGMTPVTYLAELGVLEARPTLVHAVQVTEADVRTLAEAGVRVVSCPRSNAGLEVGAFPWEVYGRYGVEVALGTDSRASSPDLDVRAEARALLEKGVEPRAVFRALTRGGYRALGLESPRLVRGTPVQQVEFW